MYFELERAEEIRASYTSWVSREAYVGERKKEVLQAIKVIAKRQNHQKAPSPIKLYKVEFQFANGSKLKPREFFALNGIGYSK